MTKIYISGPITGQENYKTRFSQAEALIKTLHAEPVNPANNPEARIWAVSSKWRRRL